LLLLAGCGSAPRPHLGALPPDTSATTPTTAAAAPTTTAVSTPQYTVATAKGASVPIFDSPVQTEPTRSLPSPQVDGSTLVFLVQDQRPDWLKVLLPVRPNGATGWIHAADVTVAVHDFHIEVDLSAHHLTVYK